jgi:hypothetical protein
LVDTLASGELDGDACLNLKSPSEPFFRRRRQAHPLSTNEKCKNNFSSTVISDSLTALYEGPPAQQRTTNSRRHAQNQTIEQIVQ